MKRILNTAKILGVKTAVCINKYNVSPESADVVRSFCGENDIPFVGCIPYDGKAYSTINAGHSLTGIGCPAGKL